MDWQDTIHAKRGYNEVMLGWGIPCGYVMVTFQTGKGWVYSGTELPAPVTKVLSIKPPVIDAPHDR